MLSEEDRKTIDTLKREIAHLEREKKLRETEIKVITLKSMEAAGIQPTYICEPSGDTFKRYLIAKKGNENLVAICLNPNTSDEWHLDATCKNIDRIASSNGYDGWVLFNLSPERIANPKELSPSLSDSEIEQTANLLLSTICSKVLSANNVLLAWGNNVDNKTKAYLKRAIVILGERLKMQDVNYWCLGITQKGHPLHPSTQALISKRLNADSAVLKPFDFLNYHKEMKRATKC